MDIQVKDVSAALGMCEKIAGHNKTMASHVEELLDILSSVNSKWESTGQDKETYMLELKKQADNLNFINQQITIFVREIKNYIQKIQETSNKSV